MTDAIVAAAIKVGVPAQLLLALCFVESSHKNVVAHHDGGSASLGICQVKQSTARMVMKNVYASDLFKPAVNAEVAARYLAYQLSRYDGNVRCAVAAYNRGSVPCTGFLTNRYTMKVEAAIRSKPWNGSRTQ